MFPKILIVDDDKDIVNVLKKSLELEDFEVMEANDGTGAIVSVKQNLPDLIVLDINLPDLSGFEVCSKIRQSGIKSPIIMLTAKADESARVKGLSSGADDYIGKPFSIAEFMARVKVQLRHLEEMRMAAQDLLRHKWEEINEGLMLVQKIQQPWTITPHEGLDFGVQYWPTGKIGGDFYYIKELDESRTAFFIGDAVGKGLAAMLLMAYTFNILNQLISKDLSPQEVFIVTNNVLRKDLSDIGSFVTAFLAVWDRNIHVLTYCNSGHQPPILMRKNFFKRTYLRTSGYFLGAFETGNYCQSQVKLNEGDRILFYTDGFLNIKDKEGRELKLSKLYQIILRNTHLPVKEVSGLLEREIEKYLEKAGSITDDMTFLLMEIK